MRDGWPAGGLTAACATEEHADCAHRKRTGGRLESGRFMVDLCGCHCHSACPVKGPGWADLDAWRESCVCPAAERLDQTLMVMGMVSEVPGGTLRMRIYPAGTG